MGCGPQKNALPTPSPAPFTVHAQPNLRQPWIPLDAAANRTALRLRVVSGPQRRPRETENSGHSEAANETVSQAHRAQRRGTESPALPANGRY